MSKEHKIKLTLEYCRRCNAAHPPGEHLAKPKKAVTTPTEIATKRVMAAVQQAVDQEAQKIMDGTSTLYPVTSKSLLGDGVALKSTAHPRGRKKAQADISQASIETIPAPANVVAEIERLGPKEIAKRKAAKKKRNKAEVQALVDAEADRKRALKNARQARWRDKQKPKARP